MSDERGNKTRGELGYVGLSALVFGMMVGAGIFNLPQNMAVSGGLWSVIISWVITAVGMMLLVYTFMVLSRRAPDLRAGMYLYAREGIGGFTGFMTAWGYWLCTAFSNVAYAVMLNDAVGAFWPVLMRHGWMTIGFGTILIWGIYFIVVSGMRTANIINKLIGMIKVLSIGMIIVMLIINIKYDLFEEALRELPEVNTLGAGLWREVEDAMMVTLWCFIGIEGAVMMSGRARDGKSVGRAGATGFFAAWILYVLVAVASYGVMKRGDMMGLENPSVAYVLRTVCGEWAYWLVVGSVIISLSGGWIAWSVVCGEVPYTAAKEGMFPRLFKKLSHRGIPKYGLLVSSVVMQLFLMVVVWSDRVYLTALNITGMMILPSYFLTGVYLWKISKGRDKREMILGVMCAMFCVWMIYAGGIRLFAETALFYLLGIGFYFQIRKEQKIKGYTLEEKIGITLLIIGSIIAVILLIT